VIEEVAVTCVPIGRIAILKQFEYEYRPPRRTEYEYRDAEYEKKHEQSIGPKCTVERF
jgi:hypothetical protein